MESSVEFGEKKKHSPDTTLHDYLGVILRGKWIIISSAVIFTIAAFVYTRTVDPVYQASASILINTRLAESPIFMDIIKRWEGEKNLTQNELEILKSKSLAAEVAQKLLIQRFLDSAKTKPINIIKKSDKEEDIGQFATVDQIVGTLEKIVDYSEVPQTDVIRISVKSRDPVEAALIANLIANVYYDRNILTSRAKSSSFREFLEAQLIDKRKTLAEAEDTLQDYMDRSGIVSLDEESRKLIEQLTNLEAQRDAADVEIQSLSKMLASYEEQIPVQQQSVAKAISEANDPYIRRLQEEIAKLEVQRDVTISQNPSITNNEIYNATLGDIEKQVKSLRDQLQKRTSDFLETLIPGTQTGVESASFLKQVMQKNLETKVQLQTLEAKKGALNDVIATYERRFAQLPGKNIRLARLQRTKMSNEKLYTSIQEKYNEALMTEQSQFGYIDVIDSATVPEKPSSPKVFLINMLGVVLGLSFGFLLVFFRERIDPRIQTPTDLKQEGLMIRGTIIQMKNGLQAEKGSPLLNPSETFSPVVEAFKHLRTNMQYMPEDRQLKSVLITSSKPGEGKTTIAANLAVTFAQLGKKVLVVDADLRKPSLHAYFKCQQVPGLTDYLLNQTTLDSAIQVTEVDTVDLISCGTPSHRTSELLGSPQMEKFLHDMESKYDLIVFDSSPILAGTEPVILSTMVDEVLMVVCSGGTRYSEFLRAMEEIEGPHGRTPGIVLNKFNVFRAYGIPYGYSGYGYYPYARKGK